MNRAFQTAYDLTTRLPVFGLSTRFRIIAADKRADRYRNMNQLEQARNELKSAILLVDKLPKARQKNSDIYSHLLGRLAGVLRELQDHRESENIYEEAIRSIRSLSDKYPKRYQPDLALTLSNYGNTLTDLGEYAKAKEKYEEAIGIRRELAKQYSEFFNPKLATTLRSYGNSLRLSGDLDASRVAYEESLTLLRSEFAGGNEEVLQLIADTLIGLSNVAIYVNDLQTAYCDCQEAVQIRRSVEDVLALAESLQNLAEVENRLDLMDLAIEHIEEAIYIFEEGSRRSPGVYLPLLASCLNNYGNILSRDKR